MNPEALPILQSRLRICRSSLSDLREASSIEDFGDHWHVFLVAWKGIYTALEQGSKGSPQSRQWFGRKKAERKSDPLLQYLFEARNDESHGLKRSVRHTQGGTKFRATTDITEMRAIFSPSGQVLKVVDVEGKEAAELIQTTGPGPELVPVTARGGVVYNPPHIHQGQQVDIRPLQIAELALTYHKALVAEAVKLPAASM